MRRRGSWRRCAGAATETAGVVEVVSCGFAPLSADPLGAGTAFDVKCLLAINSIAAVIELTVQRVDCELIFSFPIGPAYCSDADPDCSRRKLCMTANIGRDKLDEAFRRVRDLDLSLQEQLRTLAERLCYRR